MHTKQQHSVTIRRWLAIPIVATIAIPILLAVLLPAQTHRMLSGFAGAIFGEVKDHLGVVVVASVLCVLSVWAFILVRCWAEGCGKDSPTREE